MSNHSPRVANEIHGPTDEPMHSVQSSLYDQGYVNAMSHFYRGELGRIMVWRQRLDTTTNWAVTSSTAIITIAFSNASTTPDFFFNSRSSGSCSDRGAALPILRRFSRPGNVKRIFSFLWSWKIGLAGE
jgi:hypothetical protein